MSDGEQANPRRRRNRRRRRRAVGPAAPHTDPAAETGAAGRAKQVPAKPRRPESARRRPDRLRTVHETSAGGLVVAGLDGPRGDQVAALIGRLDRRGRLLWSLPKGHIEVGETAEQTAIREVAEETGIRGRVLAALGSIDYWFLSEGHRVHKTVHHYLLRFSGGELSADDVEVAEVAWVPVTELRSRLAYADERRLADVADRLLTTLTTDGPAALPPLPPSAPRRRPQTHSPARSHQPDNRSPGRKSGSGPSP